MINPSLFYNKITSKIDFISGVPDSLLKEFNACILENHPKNQHIIAPNEGVSLSLAIGNYISTGKISLIYLQNSGFGNLFNPLISLADKDIYGIPLLIIIGWRGEPGIKDEPQHYKQGLVQEDLLFSSKLKYEILSENFNNAKTQIDELIEYAYKFKAPTFLLVKKNTFSKYQTRDSKPNSKLLSREKAIKTILKLFDNETVFVGTTGKASRELYFIREESNLPHNKDFLTVGGMGHASSIATGISMNYNGNVVCLDGDGSLLMQMGSLVTNAKYASSKFFHIILNNGVHDSVGGQPTLINQVDLVSLSRSCGYQHSFKISSELELEKILSKKYDNSVFIEFKVNPGSNPLLGRPKETPKENLDNLMKYLSKK